jgi:hypothetical protein
MKMPLSEIIDRYTITLLKSERTDENVNEELQAYKKELPDTEFAEGFKEIKVNYTKVDYGRSD